MICIYDKKTTKGNKRYLKKLKVAVYFQRENINTLGTDSELILSVLSTLAQDESKNIYENTKLGF